MDDKIRNIDGRMAIGFTFFLSILLDWVIDSEVEIQSFKREQMNKIRQAAADMVVSYQREVKPTTIKYSNFFLYVTGNLIISDINNVKKVDDCGGALEEMRKGMDAAQEVAIIEIFIYIFSCDG